jgi:diguanylate cyclase (GGDEF)-like protein
MLSVPTLWTVFVVNFLAQGLFWTYVVRGYPKLEAARFWTGAAFAAALGSALAMLRFEVESLLPLLIGGTMMIFAACLAAMGIKRFYDQPVSWRGTALITGLSFAGLTFFIVGYDSMPMRVLVHSLGQALPLALILKLLLSRQDDRKNPGARLTGIVAILIIAVYTIRAGGSLLQVGGGFSYTGTNPLQSVLVLVMMFLSIAWNFGFLLMAIDLDGFKATNDTHGHAAGDACLQHFTLMAQTRLRPGDMLARTGGDEFCIVLPASTLREGAMIARRILDVCRDDAAACVGADIPVAISIGVAQWTGEIGAFPDRLIGAADRALYAAKNDGKNRYAVHDPSPPLAPGHQAMPEPVLRKHA